MANWQGFTLTTLGKELNAKVNAGLTTLKFNRVALGSGINTSANATSLMQEEQTFVFDVNPPTVNGNVMILEFTAHNKDLQKQYTITELGLFAQDPDKGSILFAYMTDAAPDIMPTNGSATVVNRKIKLHITTNNTGNVSVVTSGKFVTIEDLNKHNADNNAHADQFNVKLDIKSPNYIQTIGKASNGIQITKGDSSKSEIDFISSNLNDTDKSKVPSLNALQGLISLVGEGAIVASKLTGNTGYVKFANGFIIQWGQLRDVKVGTEIPLPIQVGEILAVVGNDENWENVPIILTFYEYKTTSFKVHGRRYGSNAGGTVWGRWLAVCRA